MIEVVPCPPGHQTMINKQGNVKVIPLYLVDTKRADGWKIVINPKQSYFPEFDTNRGGTTAPEMLNQNIDESDALRGEDV